MVRGGVDPNLIDLERMEVRCANPNCTNAISGISRYCSTRCASEHARILHPERYKKANEKHRAKIKKEKEKKRMLRMKKDPKFRYQEMLKCPICNSSHTAFNFTDSIMQCYKCGHRFKRPEPPKELKEKIEPEVEK